MGSLHYWILFALFLSVCLFCFGQGSREYGQIQNDILVCSMSRPDKHVRLWQTAACTQPVICRDRGATCSEQEFCFILFCSHFLFLTKKDQLSESQSWDIWQKSKFYRERRTCMYSLMNLIFQPHCCCCFFLVLFLWPPF